MFLFRAWAWNWVGRLDELQKDRYLFRNTDAGSNILSKGAGRLLAIIDRLFTLRKLSNTGREVRRRITRIALYEYTIHTFMIGTRRDLSELAMCPKILIKALRLTACFRKPCRFCLSTYS